MITLLGGGGMTKGGGQGGRGCTACFYILIFHYVNSTNQNKKLKCT